MVRKNKVATHPYEEAMKHLLNQDGILALFIEDTYLKDEEKTIALEAIRQRLGQVVSQDGLLLGLFKPKYQTYDLCWHAISNNGLAIQFVRSDLMTLELGLEAMKQTPLAFPYIPQPLQTPEMCLEAVQTDVGYIEYVRKDFMTFEFCLEAMQRNPMILPYIKEHFEIPSFTLETKSNSMMNQSQPEGSLEPPQNIYPLDSQIQQEAI